MKNYDFRATSNPDLERVVDRRGDWNFYRYKQKRFLRGITTVLNDGLAKSEAYLRALKYANPIEWERKFFYASDKGDAVHQAIFNTLNGIVVTRFWLVLAEDNRTERQITDAEWSCLTSWARFWREHDCVLVAHEAAVCNPKRGIAGTLDILFRMRKACGYKGGSYKCPCEDYVGLLLLGDWKTGGGIYESHEAQVAALATCDLSTLIGQRKIEATCVIRLGTTHKRGFEVAFYDSRQRKKHLRRFNSALVQAQEKRPMFNKDDIFDDPETLDVRIERENLAPASAQEAA